MTFSSSWTTRSGTASSMEWGDCTSMRTPGGEAVDVRGDAAPITRESGGPASRQRYGRRGQMPGGTGTPNRSPSRARSCRSVAASG
jgi:hypothetical protein